MALSSWKVKKHTKAPVTREVFTGGGESTIAAIATIAASTGNYKSDIATIDQATINPNTEPVKEWGQRQAFYKTLVSCQQCNRLGLDGYCCKVDDLPMVDALRACESFVQVQVPRPKISTVQKTPDTLLKYLAKYAMPLLWHLVHCRECIFEYQYYCPDGCTTGRAYEDALLVFDDVSTLREKMLTAIVKARRKQ